MNDISTNVLNQVIASSELRKQFWDKYNYRYDNVSSCIDRVRHTKHSEYLRVYQMAKETVNKYKDFVIELGKWGKDPILSDVETITLCYTISGMICELTVNRQDGKEIIC